MKPVVSTLAQRAAALPRQWAEARKQNPDFGSAYPDTDDVIRALLALPEPTVEAVQAVLGSRTNVLAMLSVHCLGCGLYWDRGVQVGEEPDYDTATTTLCRSCLVEALAALDAVSGTLTSEDDLAKRVVDLEIQLAQAKLQLEVMRQTIGDVKDWSDEGDIMEFEEGAVVLADYCQQALDQTRWAEPTDVKREEAAGYPVLLPALPPSVVKALAPFHQWIPSAGEPLCLVTIGSKECVLRAGHGGDYHASKSGTSWPMTLPARPAHDEASQG